MRDAHGVVLIAAALVLGGCSLILDEKVGGLEHDTVPDVVVSLEGFDAHENERVEVLVVSESGFVQAHAVLDVMPEPDFLLKFEDLFVSGDRRVDFWADNDGNDVLTPPERDPLSGTVDFDDHMWREMLDASGRLSFPHDTDFVDIVAVEPAQTVAGPFTLRVIEADAHTGAPAEVLLWRTDTNVQIGYYLEDEIVNGAFTAPLVGIIEDEVVYRAEIVIGALRLCGTFTGTATGIDVEHEIGEFGECPE